MKNLSQYFNNIKSKQFEHLAIQMHQDSISDPSKPLKQFNKFEVPPNFALSRFHAKCCQLYKTDTKQIDDLVENLNLPTCPCCKRKKGYERISMCDSQEYMQSIAEEVPLFFSLRYILALFIILVIFVKVAEFIWQCDSDQCRLIKYDLSEAFGYAIIIPLGYMNSSDKDFMIQTLIYTTAICFFKFKLKRKKYKSRERYGGIEKRSVMLINLSKQSQPDDINKLFQGFLLDDITFTYKVTDYHDAMAKMHKLQKQLVLFSNKYTKNRKFKQTKKKQQIQVLRGKIESVINELEGMRSSIIQTDNRTSLAFVVLNSKNEKQKVINRFSCNFITKLLYKCFPKFSRSSIHNQHISIVTAPAPDDIIWQNLGNPYLTTKIFRFFSFFVCLTILIFGMVSEIFIMNSSASQILSDKIISTVVIFLINFFIINFLEWTTHQIQRRTSITSIKLSLIRKITFFMFINISITPYFLFIKNLISQEKNGSSLESVGFQLLLIAISNCFKPLLTIFSVQRILKWIKQNWEESKAESSALNQMQANQLFQPLQFPIEIYYSLVHTSIMMMFFYMSYYQFLIIIELPALLLLFFIAKWMLVRVCKKPIGISLRLNNLAQSLMRIYVLLYWIGTYSIKYLMYRKYYNQEQKAESFIEFSITKNIYTIISICVCGGFFLFSQPVIASIVRRMSADRNRISLGKGLLVEDIMEKRSYKQANMGFTINGQSYSEIKSRLMKLDNKFLQQLKN